MTPLLVFLPAFIVMSVVAGTLAAASGSLNVTAIVSPASALPAVPPALLDDVTRIGTGGALSTGTVEANVA